MNSLAKSLLSFARESEENLVKIKKWRNDALESMATGNGSQLVTGSGNGVSFAVDTYGLKVSEWFDVLQQVIDAVSLGYSPSTTQARF